MGRSYRDGCARERHHGGYVDTLTGPRVGRR
jgi:hypothetical protein